MDASSIAAVLFAVVAAGAIGFQLALAGGAPWGSYAMGGAYPGRLPAPMRIVALVQAAILGLLGAVVLAHAGLVTAAWLAELPWLIWVAVGFSFVSLVLNSITSSVGERRIWVPVAVVMLGSSLVVALAG